MLLLNLKQLLKIRLLLRYHSMMKQVWILIKICRLCSMNKCLLDIVAGQSIDSRHKLIALQRKDKSLAKYFDLVQSPDANDENFFVLKNEVLVRCARNRIRPVGLEITQIVVPIVLRNKLLGLS